MDTFNQLILDKGIITDRGICYKNIYYSCRIAIKENWFNQTLISEEASYITVVIDSIQNIVISVISHNGIIHDVWKLQEHLVTENIDYFEQLNFLKDSIKEKKENARNKRIISKM